MPLTRTDWIHDPENNEWVRNYRTDDGTEVYEVYGAEGTFYSKDGVAPLARAVTEQLGLSVDSQTIPRHRPPLQASSPNRSARDLQLTESNYEVASGSGLSVHRSRASQVDEDEDEEDEDGNDDQLPDLPVLSREALVGRPLSSTPARNLSVNSTGSLPQGYEVKEGKFFHRGRVFRFLCAEAAGTTSRDYVDDKAVYTTLRPMIVVKKSPAHCICVPIFSYGQQGVARASLTPSEVRQHAIVHMRNTPARLTPDEEARPDGARISVDDAFTIHPASSVSRLSASSRVRFDTPYTVRYNLKVLDLGTVIRLQRQKLKERWQLANAD